MRKALAFVFFVAVGCGTAKSGDAPSDERVDVEPTDPSVTPPDAPRPTAEDGGTTNPDGGVVEAAKPYVHFDVNHVLSTGQSNAVANDGVPVLSKSQPYGNLMFDVGVLTGASCDGDGCRRYDAPKSFVPLVEGDTFFYPVETMSSALANEVSKIAGIKHDILMSLHGRSGNGYWCLRKGGCPWWAGRGYQQPFEDGMKQVAAAKAIAQAQGKSYVVRAVTAVHGEHDHYSYSSGSPYYPLPGTDGQSTVADYADGLLEWQRDYETSVKAITGQTIDVPLFVSQYTHWNDVAHSKIPYMQLAAHEKSKGKVVVVGPTYALPYDTKCLHFSSYSQRWLGEYFAKAYARVVIQGKKWEPLRPTAVTRAGNVITAKLHVPVPPIVIDTTRVVDPGNYGFEVVDAQGTKLPITSVAVAGPDAIAVTLGAAPPAGARLRYAYTFTGCGGALGPGTRVARGNVRDSDATPSEHGYDLSNWLVHFEMNVP